MPTDVPDDDQRPVLPPTRPRWDWAAPVDRLPADDVATRNVPPREGVDAGDEETHGVASVADPAPIELPGEHLPTRNVPPPPTIVAESPRPDPEQPFALPDLEPMGHATTALLVGRVLFALAALVVGLAARRATQVGGDDRTSVFWSVAVSAGVFALVGVAALAFWSSTLTVNARRLRARTPSAGAIGWSWLLPVAWVAISSATYLQFTVDAEVDPLPGVAGVGWVIALTVAYGRLQSVFRALSRTPPILWISAFPLDLVAFGLIWWRLTSWPSPVGPERDHAELTANIAFGAAAALALNVLVFVWLAQRAGTGLYERLGRLEALHSPDVGNPEWFRAGLAARRFVVPPVARPLIPTNRLSSIVAALHVAWGVALVGFGVVVGLLAFEYSDAPVFLGGELVVDDGDADRLVLAGTIVGLVYLAAILGHGVWAVLSAINARRVTVHSPEPGTFIVAFAPAPLLIVAGLVIGGRLGYWVVVAGLTVAFFALVLVNQMLMALSARLGGQLLGFSRWTLCLSLTYLAGVVLNVLFWQSSAQLGFYATLALVQGALIAIGGVMGYSAMTALDATMSSHRRLTRAEG